MQTRTTTTLLENLRDPDNASAWQRFDARYRPVLIAFARKLGLGDEDAADAAQETLVRFVGLYGAGTYRRERGRLSSWIIGIARNCIIEQRRARATRREWRGMSALKELPDDNHLSKIWDAECDREVLRHAIRSLRRETRIDARTISAFELLAFRQLSPSEVAVKLDMTMNEVYLAKHRCLKRLRLIITSLEAAYEIAN